MSKQHTIKQIEEALEKGYGMQTYAAELLGITYQAIWKRIKGSPQLQAALKRIEEKCLDFSEVALMKNVKKGKEASIFFHLKCKGKKRGYIEKVALEHSGEIKGGDVTVNVKPEWSARFTSETIPDIDKNNGSTDKRFLHAGPGTNGDRVKQKRESS